MARKVSTVYEGKFMDALRSEYEKKCNTIQPFMRTVQDPQRRVARKTLEKPELIEIFQKLNWKVIDVFEAAGLPFTISEEEKNILSTLENISAGKQKQILSVIRNICDPWWVATLDSDKDSPSSVLRFKQFASHKYAASAENDITSPLLQSMFPYRMIAKIPTDIYPQFCLDAGVPVSFLMDLPMSKIRFYSDNAMADRIFTEYKLIYSDELRDIVKQVILNTER